MKIHNPSFPIMIALEVDIKERGVMVTIIVDAHLAILENNLVAKLDVEDKKKEWKVLISDVDVFIMKEVLTLLHKDYCSGMSYKPFQVLGRINELVKEIKKC